MTGRAYDGDEAEYTEAERDTIQIVDNTLYRHKTLRVNYTTYDLRRQQDSINPRTHPDIMLLSHEDAASDDAHPYWYARVIGIFHVDVTHTGPLSKSSHKQRVNFLWIRWFGRDLPFKAGWQARRLHRIGFLNAKESGAFGFLDPALVVRGIHLIPAFAQGKTNELLSPARSVARMPFSETEDWQYHYVNMYVLLITLHNSHQTFNRFVDRDMFMRFLGGGVGHKATNALTIHLRHEVPGNNPTSSTTDDVADYVAHYPGDEDTEEKDYGYCIDDSDSEDEDADEGIEGDDMGAEDGEEPWDMSVVEAEGYDEL